MKVAIIGAGGIGGYYAARFQEAGNEVSIVARGKQLEALRENGLKIISPKGNFSDRIKTVTSDPYEIGKVDLVIVAVKAWQVDEIATHIMPLIDKHTTVVPVQNGVEAYSILGKRFPDNAIGGLARIISYVESPGVIRHVGGETFISIGDLEGKANEKLVEVCSAFNNAGINCEIADDIVKAIWEKFVIMATFGGVGSITQVPMGVLLSLKETEGLIEESMDEIVNVAAKIGVKLTDESKTKAWNFLRSLPYESTSSTQRDIAAGKPSEIENLSGAVFKMGLQHGVETPLHKHIYLSLLPKELIARGEIKAK